MNQLQNKSEIFESAAKLLHGKGLYAAVAHGAYYSCYQLMKHIWLFAMGKTQQELDMQNGIGSHKFLIDAVIYFIKHSGRKDCMSHFHDLNSKMWQLRKLRTTADYDNASFDSLKSFNSLSLNADIIFILKKY